PAGDVVAVGEAQELALDQFGRVVTNGRHLLVARLARETGAVQWTKVLPEISSARRVVVDGNGDLIVAGAIAEPGSAGTCDFLPKDVLVLKLSAGDGTELWRATVGGVAGGAFDSASALVVDAAGDIVIGGQLHTVIYDPFFDNSLGTGVREFLVAKLAGDDG